MGENHQLLVEFWKTFQMLYLIRKKVVLSLSVSIFPSVRVGIQKSAKSLSHGTFTASVPNNEISICMCDCSADENYIPTKKRYSGKATGIDEFSIKFLKTCSHVSAQLLRSINKNWFLQSIFPDYLKIAKVAPIQKSESKTNGWRLWAHLCSSISR